MRAVNRSRAAAGAFLAVNLALHILRRMRDAVVRRGDASAEFSRNFSGEGLFVLAEDDRTPDQAASGCINCGLCLYGAPHAGDDPRFIAGAASRDLTGWTFARRALMSPDDASAAVEKCPTAVPVGAMIRIMEKPR